MRRNNRGSNSGGGVTRRQALKTLGATGIGSAAASTAFSPYVFAQKAPVALSFWTFENPQQRPWLQKRIKMFTDANPNVKVDIQAFTFQDLGKKLSVGFATGTAPDGFVSQDWFMPLWLQKNLLAPMDVQRLGYSSISRLSPRTTPTRSSPAPPRTARPTAIRCGSTASATTSTPSSSRRSGSIRTRTGRRPGTSSARSPSD